MSPKAQGDVGFSRLGSSPEGIRFKAVLLLAVSATAKIIERVGQMSPLL